MGGGGLSVVGAVESAAAEWMPWIRKRFRVRPEIEKQLLGISARQIDRRLAGKKTQRRRRIYGHTKPGYLLKHHIPVKTDSWDVQRPGFTEVDLVSHSGNSAEGEFAHTLNVTDIQTGWTESRALLGRAGGRAAGSRRDSRGAALPLLGVDSDNGSEFINWHLKRWCEQKEIQLTRDGPTRRTTTPTSSRRTGRMCASCWAGNATTRTSGGGDERSLPAGTAPMAEPVSALGEAGEEGSRGIESAARL